MTSLEYSEKLKDPRWQKKRLEIFERDGWACQICYSKDITLTVHHRRYLPNQEPWDYPNEYLITLCKSCHEDEKGHRPDIEADLIGILRLKFNYLDLNILLNGLMNIPDIPQQKSDYYLLILNALRQEYKDWLVATKKVNHGKSST